MKTYDLSDAKIYVGTYENYNNGSLPVGWLNLSDYSNKEEFFEACRELHNDEKAPEFMFQDWENIPEALISESWLSENFFDLRDAMEDFIDTEKDAFFVWVEYECIDFNKEDAYDLVNRFKDSYVGEYDEEEEFAYQMVEECYDLPDFAKTYFDYEKFARDLFMCDYYFENGFVFKR